MTPVPTGIRIVPAGTPLAGPIMVAKAMEIAVQLYANKVDRFGEPLIFHPMRVAEAVRGYGSRAEAIAWLHDVVEDMPGSLLTNLAWLRTIHGMPENVVEAVDVVTRRINYFTQVKEAYLDAFIPRVKLHAMGTVIKTADIRDHLDPVRIHQISPSQRRKYEKALEYLEA